MVTACLLKKERTLLENHKVGVLEQLERPSGDLTSKASLETFLRFSLAELVCVGSGFTEVLFIVRMRIRVTVCACNVSPFIKRTRRGLSWNSNKAWHVSMFMCGENGPQKPDWKYGLIVPMFENKRLHFICSSPNRVMTVDTAVNACFDVIHILKTSNFLELLSGSQTQTGCAFVWLWSSSHIQHSETLCLILLKCFKYNLKLC